MEHLGELRKRLLISVFAILIGGTLAFIFYAPILDFLSNPYCDVVEPGAQGLLTTSECTFLVTDPLEPFTVRLMVALYGGLLGAMPILLYQLWRFVIPGLYSKERNLTLFFVLSAFLLFAGGVALAFWTVPRALEFLSSIGGEDFANVFSPRKYLSFLVRMMLAFGIGFLFPVVLVFLQLVGILGYKALSRARPFTIVGLVCMAAVLTPSGDPITLAVLSVPLYFFFELSVIFGWLLARRRRKQVAAQDNFQKN